MFLYFLWFPAFDGISGALEEKCKIFSNTCLSDTGPPKLVVFCGTFTAGGLKTEVAEGRLRIVDEGRVRKFVDRVEHVTFSGKLAAAKGQQVLYVTERCVFSLTSEGMELVEIAPGIDLERDILAHMDFTPVIRGGPRRMDGRIFEEGIMAIREEMLELSLAERLTYDPGENLFFVNFEGFSVTSSRDVKEIEEAVSRILTPLDRKVYTIVNYDNFFITPDVVDEYTDMVKGLVDRFYSGVTRYTTSTFLRMKIGAALKQREVAPHIYESREEARKALAGVRKRV